jgi:hypothetical protein
MHGFVRLIAATLIGLGLFSAVALAQGSAGAGARSAVAPPPTSQSGTQLRFRKVVQSNAPGGGYPLTGLTFGSMFEIFHSCTLGGQSYTNVTDVPGGSTLPVQGHTNIPVGAVCTVTETPPQGPIPWTPCPTGVGRWDTPVKSPHPLTMAPGANLVTVTNRFVCDKPPPPARICVLKYNDLNGNGMRDAGEPPLSGWTFSVKIGGGATVSTGTTNAQGKFCTPDALAAGGYTVVETLKPGWVSSSPGGANPARSLVLAAGQTRQVEFGNRKAPPTPGGLCVVKFHDLNGDGVRQTGEPALGGWQFTLTGPSGPLTGSTGDQGGQWCTSRTLSPGTYTITETMKPGWISTTPGGAAPQLTAVVTAGQVTQVVFGNRRKVAS